MSSDERRLPLLAPDDRSIAVNLPLSLLQKQQKRRPGHCPRSGNASQFECKKRLR